MFKYIQTLVPQFNYNLYIFINRDTVIDRYRFCMFVCN